MSIRSILIPVFLFVFTACQNQETTRDLNSQETPSEYQDPCETRMSEPIKFPFEDSLDKVLVVSYEFPRSGYGLLPEEREKFTTNEILGEDGKIGFNVFQEQIELNSGQIDMLKDSVFNYNGDYLLGADCYRPRNCVYFLDQNELVLGYLEICFECSNTLSSHDELEINCENQLSALNDLLIEFGLTNGVKK